mmetsp:Transcript_6802/g.10647  ORF Transcript_6802/g.10647 Transcript_6802/m.10647 type:complete len:598 (+) Transcript_6802:249-2042(+)
MSIERSIVEPIGFAGVATRPDGSRYDGEMACRVKDGTDYMFVETGRGVKMWANGNRYEGLFKEGKRNGQGILVRQDGTKFEGDWLNDRPDGLGVLSEANGGRYIEEWVDSVCLRRSKLPDVLPPVVLDTLSSALVESVNNSQFSDIRFKVDGRDFYAHRLICAARSPLFRSMFTSPTQILTTSSASDGAHMEFVVRDTSYASFELLMGYIYTGSVDLGPALSSSDLFGLLDLSCQHRLDQLKETCERRLAQTITVDTVLSVLLSADMYNALRLQDACRPFIRQLETEQTRDSRDFAYIVQSSSRELRKIIESENPKLLAVLPPEIKRTTSSKSASVISPEERPSNRSESPVSMLSSGNSGDHPHGGDDPSEFAVPNYGSQSSLLSSSSAFNLDPLSSAIAALDDDSLVPIDDDLSDSRPMPDPHTAPSQPTTAASSHSNRHTKLGRQGSKSSSIITVGSAHSSNAATTTTSASSTRSSRSAKENAPPLGHQNDALVEDSSNNSNNSKARTLMLCNSLNGSVVAEVQVCDDQSCATNGQTRVFVRKVVDWGYSLQTWKGMALDDFVRKDGRRDGSTVVGDVAVLVEERDLLSKDACDI